MLNENSTLKSTPLWIKSELKIAANPGLAFNNRAQDFFPKRLVLLFFCEIFLSNLVVYLVGFSSITRIR